MPSGEPRVVLVVGASGGIGAAVAANLSSRAGTKVYGASRRAEGAGALACDLRDTRSVRAAVERILAESGGLDAVVDCATAPLRLKRFEQLSADEIREDVETVLLGGMLLAEAVLPAMRARGAGTLIYLLSQATQTLPARMSTYAAAKAGLATFVTCLAKEVAPRGIRVLGLSPSFVETPLLKGFPEKLLELERDRRASGRLMQPGEIAERVAAMLDSPERFPAGTIESCE